jgi:phosphomevalonate kinase
MFERRRDKAPADGSRRTFFAPGKLMLAGEYSVLGPVGVAVAVAIDSGVALIAEPTDQWELRRLDCDVAWREGQPVPDELRFVHHAWQLGVHQAKGELSPHRFATRPGGIIRGTGKKKPGIGGSASATVATLTAIDAISPAPHGLNQDAQRVENGRQCHRTAQAELGSGYDIATIVYGGALVWRRLEPGWNAPYGGEQLSWPQEWLLLAGYTGRSASTTHLVASMFASRDSGRDTLADDLAHLGQPVTAVVQALRERRLDQMALALVDCHERLVHFDRSRRLSIVTPEISGMLASASKCGAAAKISGAGGGDSVIALCRDLDQTQRLAHAWRAEGFEPFPVTVTDRGAHEITTTI